jgi:hypothetical protein
MYQEDYQGHVIVLRECSLCALHIFVDGVDINYRIPDAVIDHNKFALAVARGVVDRTCVIEDTAAGVVEDQTEVGFGPRQVREPILC